MKTLNPVFRSLRTIRLLAFACFVFCTLEARAQVGPDLTSTDLALINTTRNFNLGPTGMRGWIYVPYPGGAAQTSLAEEGRMTSFAPYQILVTTVGTNTPAWGIFVTNDVILGVNTGSNNIPVPFFTNDSRKSLGWAIGAAEAGDGWMNFKRWRAGVTSDVSIRLPLRGLAYSATAPYNCPKTAVILSNACTIISNRLFNVYSPGNQVLGLALLASGNTNFLPKVQAYARSITVPASVEEARNLGLVMWDLGYNGIFLSEYFLKTGDTNVLPQIAQCTLVTAGCMDRYGTVCHGPSLLNADGSYNGTAAGYGPVNQVGLACDLGLVLGQKCLVAAGMTVDPSITNAINRASNFFGWYVQKGNIQYGEHSPIGGPSHAGNGKEGLAALMFALMGNKPVETEYWTRMTIAGYAGREYGHTGQGFAFLWGGPGANVGGTNAMAAYLSQIQWHLDLERRCDGSFCYDGAEQYGPSSGVTDYWTVGGNNTYDGCGLDPTATYVLTYGAALQQLYITGKNANPTNALSSAAVSNAIWSASFSRLVTTYDTNALTAALGEYDPCVRIWAARELGKRPGISASNMIALVGSTNAWLRASACAVLGVLTNSSALPTLGQCLTNSDIAVRAYAAMGLKNYGAAASNQIATMLAAFINNAGNPNVIDWNDPLQTPNGILNEDLFGGWIMTNLQDGDGLVPLTAAANRNLLYPALRAALKHPDSLPRGEAAAFVKNSLTLADVQVLATDIIQCATATLQADPMWRTDSRVNAIQTLAKYNCAEAIPVALYMMNPPWIALYQGDSVEDDSPNASLNALAGFGDAVRWTLPTLGNYLGAWGAGSGRFSTLVNSMTSIDSATSAPAITNLFPVAYSQVVATTNAKAITLTGSSCRTNAVTFLNVTAPSHGQLTGTAPSLNYIPDPGYSGVDRFMFQVADNMTNSGPATVSIIVGAAGGGLKGEYYDNVDFTNLKFTRIDPQINFDWGAGSPSNSIAASTYSIRWSGLLLAPESGNYKFSTLNSDGARVYVNGTLMVDDWVDQVRRWTDGATLALTAGQKYVIQMDFFENVGDGVAKLKWTGPSFAGSNGVLIAKEWLYDSTGMTNQPLFAYAQSVVMVQNTNQVVTLEGSVGTSGYQILSGPANGSLTGSPPVVTYTPATNYTGADSFTFQVSNGVSTSTPATVSINVLVGQSLAFYWTNPVGGVWSVAGNWTNSAGGSIAPGDSGQPYYSLNFNRSGTYGSTNDFNSGFKVNRLNCAAEVTVEGNSISPINNGTNLPQVTQNSADAITINSPLHLGASTTIGGLGSGNVNLGGVISGDGGLIINTYGSVMFRNMTNTYMGGTVINAGSVNGPTGSGSITPIYGTGSLTINAGGTLVVDRAYLTNAIAWNGGTVTGGNSFPSEFSGPVTLAGVAMMDLGTTGGFTISGNIKGSGGVTTVGTTSWHLSGTNTYTGPTTIADGSISFDKSGAVAPGLLNVYDGAIANLNYTGTRTINWLILGGTDKPSGIYGSLTSTATYKDSHISGNGTVTVSPVTGTISNRPASNATATNATLNATLSGNGLPYTVVAYWNKSNGGTNAAAWTNSALVGSWTVQSPTNVSCMVTGLLANTQYYFTFRATNSLQNIWATNVLTFNSPTTVAVASSLGSNGVYGQQIVFTATVSVITNGPATGLITFLDGANTLATVALNGAGAAAYTNSTLIAGGHSITANYGGDAQFPPSSSSPFAYTVSPKTVSVTGVTASTKTYDQTTAATLNGGTVSGVINSDTVTVVSGTGTFASANVGTWAVTALGYSIGGAGGSNYVLSAQPNPGSASITPLSVSISGVTASNKVYDGISAATLNGGIVSGVFTGDVVTVVSGTGTFASSNVGTWAVTATNFAIGGVSAGNYSLSSQPNPGSAGITARLVQLAGTRTYDGTTNVAVAALSILNNIDGTNLMLAGTANMAAKDVGARALVFGQSASPVRVQSATGSVTAASTYNVTLAATPSNGNTLIAVTATRGVSTNRVTGIGQAGAIWSRVAQAANAAGVTVEIWYAPNVSNAAATVTITNAATLRAAALVIEYSGLLATGAVDQTTNATGTGTAAVTGTTPTTTQASELWLAGIGIADGRRTLNAPYGNAFAAVASSSSGTTPTNAMIYGLEKITNATGAASSSGTVSASDGWAGAIATFKAVNSSSLTLTGSAAGNYTLSGATCTVTVTSKLLAAAGLTASNKVYNGTTVAPMSGTAALLGASAPGGGTSGDGKPYTGDAISLTGAASGAFADKNIGSNKVVTVSGLSLTGAQTNDYVLAPLTNLTATISSLSITVAAVATTKTYDGTTAASGTPTIAPALAAGDTTNSLSQAFQNPNAGISNRVLVPSIVINDGNSGTNYAVTLQNFLTGTINPAPATVTLGNLAVIYDGTPKSVTVGTTPTNEPVTVTYNGSASAPITAGSYTVAAIVTSTNYQGGATNTLTIQQATQTITFGPLTVHTVGDPVFGLTATASSGLAITYSNSDPTVATISGTNVTILASGTATLTANQAGNTNYSAAVPVNQTLIIRLPAPTNLTAVSTNAVIQLNWSAVTGALGYAVKRSFTNAGPYVALAFASTPSYSDAAVSNAVTYYYVVAATNAVGLGADSAIVTAQFLVDSDADGMPDWWETLHGLNSSNPTDASLDSDGDGMTNLQEFLAGTDPQDPASLLRISESAALLNGLNISFMSISGKIYAVERCLDMAITNGWNSITNNVGGTGGPISTMDPAVAQPHAYYRVRLIAP